ncbi:hypothetical protein PQR34_25870 [Paraburkholderia sediminicola]|uniref:hypothetical protein n=1 Tax=Paraburkholderia sediminicola TaxID=458836 RepID=UPI0038BBE080
MSMEFRPSTATHHMSLQELLARTEAFVAEMTRPLDHYSDEDRAMSAKANARLRGVYAREFIQLMRQQYIIDTADNVAEADEA